MKRKIFILAIVTIIAFSCIAFAACGNGTAKNKLSYGKKYIYDSDLSSNVDEARYFIFNKNGTGIYHYYYESSYYDTVSAYTIKFKYVIDADNEVVYCFYDSIVFDDKYNDTDDENDDKYFTDWSAVLNFTDKFLYSIDSAYPHFYVTEEFSSKTIPNYCK